MGGATSQLWVCLLGPKKKFALMIGDNVGRLLIWTGTEWGERPVGRRGKNSLRKVFSNNGKESSKPQMRGGKKKELSIQTSGWGNLNHRKM